VFIATLLCGPELDLISLYRMGPKRTRGEELLDERVPVLRRVNNAIIPSKELFYEFQSVLVE
jgi:hypothetical protein